MWTKNIAITGTWALGTMLAVTLLWGTARIDAAGELDSPTPIVKPVLLVNGVEMTVNLDTPSTKRDALPRTPLKPGPAPKLVLVARNIGPNPCDLPWSIRMQTTIPTSPLSRVMPASKTAWEKSGQIVLAPGKTATLPLDPQVELRPGELVNIQISSGKQTIVPLAMSVEPEMKLPSLAKR